MGCELSPVHTRAAVKRSFSVGLGLPVSLQAGPQQAISTAEIKAQGCLLVTPVNYSTTGGHLRRNDLSPKRRANTALQQRDASQLISRAGKPLTKAGSTAVTAGPRCKPAPAPEQTLLQHGAPRSGAAGKPPSPLPLPQPDPAPPRPAPPRRAIPHAPRARRPPPPHGPHGPHVPLQPPRAPPSAACHWRGRSAHGLSTLLAAPSAGGGASGAEEPMGARRGRGRGRGRMRR
ncbi:uncharacterized protein LOC136050463 [Cyrtonyx montezumae]|uniref:uncharacterized protein LOC136050463 n=1 Tax=Cyrtonyx montezumae TaxID=9017 RepID=UPI0032DAA949